MSWSWKIARVAGIDVYVHATFFVLLAWIAVVHWTDTRTLTGVVSGVGFILALFACVVLHEFGHALTGESSVVQMKAALAGIPVQRAMMTQYRTLTPSDTLQTGSRFPPERVAARLSRRPGWTSRGSPDPGGSRRGLDAERSERAGS